ncbi:glycoside hydrolase family 2 protein [Spirosoma sp. KCTC 42546]|uniref:glycoside hydrolase family 2 TIM barrel-domain containing protein n=1 Tax=Spirosoma sp. KCTC 42546 TaxID=2520506 RepID=UPI0011576F13|nr:glycoside hydrolase family 2 TIM barrel-domain containing protein [Spirosoma sp. KCTC 42546]QDK78297.1 glycoside hydrolase family 2 protein [Spirosoma sp. KCTC 42546]
MLKLLLFVCSLLTTITTFSQTKPTRTRLVDADWRFLKDSTVKAELPTYNDANWRRLDLPHDWSIEDLPGQMPNQVAGPFSRASAGGTSTGYAVGGVGWYRKSFTINPSEAGKMVGIQFDGAYMETDVWLNGHHLGYHPYGYTSFGYDLTPYLLPLGQTNVLAVRVKNLGQNSRWYTGSGIYRHVWLTVAESVHIIPMGVSITTPQVSGKTAQIQAITTISNSTGKPMPISVQTTLMAPNGKSVGTSWQEVTVSGNGRVDCKQLVSVATPQLWSTETPWLYRANVVLVSGKKRLDSLTIAFGIRSVQVDAEHGFVLNGKRVLLKGGCVHHDNGPLGAAAIDRAEERKVELLKANGFNAVRTSHNPPSTAFLDACDRLGLLVIDEAFDMWQRPKKPQDYHRFFDEWRQRDLEAMILRDRNHPSVILWSIGNEINERADSSGLTITKQLADAVHRLDPTRPVTEALCVFWEHRGKVWEDSDKAFALLDVGGYNYEWKHYETDHQRHPNRVILGTETFAKEAFENWQQVEKHPYVIGDFVWTAMDYMGETAIGHALLQPKSAKDSTRAVLPWPWFNAWCGDLDLIGFKKPQSYYRDVVWRNRPIAMAVHSPIPDGMKETVTNWGWPDEHQSWSWAGAEGKPLQVRVFSRSSLVRLELNGKLIGEKHLSDSIITATFTVPYQPGRLKATSFDRGKLTGSTELITAGKPHHLRLIADRATIRADRSDLSYVSVEVVDANENRVPDGAIPISFQLTGVGELVGVGTANPTDLSSFQAPQKTTFQGRCLAIVRPKGRVGVISIQATAPNLQAAVRVINVKEN